MHSDRGSIQSIKSIYPEISANAILVIIGVACALLDRQITKLGKDFEEQGVLLNAFTGCARPEEKLTFLIERQQSNKPSWVIFMFYCYGEK